MYYQHPLFLRQPAPQICLGSMLVNYGRIHSVDRNRHRYIYIKLFYFIYKKIIVNKVQRTMNDFLIVDIRSVSRADIRYYVCATGVECSHT